MDKKKDNPFRNLAVRGTILVMTGVGYALGTIISCVSNSISDAEIFQREEGKPAVIRIYRRGPCPDGFLIQDRDKIGRERYMNLSKYLETINEADRRTEERAIVRAAHWYDKEDK